MDLLKQAHEEIFKKNKISSSQYQDYIAHKLFMKKLNSILIQFDIFHLRFVCANRGLKFFSFEAQQSNSFFRLKGKRKVDSARTQIQDLLIELGGRVSKDFHISYHNETKPRVCEKNVTSSFDDSIFGGTRVLMGCTISARKILGEDVYCALSVYS